MAFSLAFKATALPHLRPGSLVKDKKNQDPTLTTLHLAHGQKLDGGAYSAGDDIHKKGMCC